jgi:PAS domain S-box-containing protein
MAPSPGVRSIDGDGGQREVADSDRPTEARLPRPKPKVGRSMLDFLKELLDTSGFPPRWHCGTWSESLGWLHILSDLAIWSAYFAIPVILVYFVMRRRDIPFSSVFWLFGAFILACGTTHLVEAIIFWKPVYRLAGFVKLFTALVSWGTVVALIPTVPKAMAMRSPEELEREITARKNAEEALRQTNVQLEKRVQERTAELAQANAILQQERETLRITLASIGDGVITTDTAGRVTFLNPVAESLTGWNLAEATGQPLVRVFNIINEESRQSVEDPTGRALRDGTVVGLANHTLLVAPDGTERPIDDSAAPITDRQGQILGVVLVFQDITERKQAELAMRESERREKERAAELEAIMRAAPTAITIAHDPQAHRITGNAACYALLGLPEGSNSSSTPPEGEPHHQRFREYRDGVPVPGDQLPVQVAARGTEVHGAELTLVFNDGTQRDIYCNAVPLLNSDGTPRGAIAAFMDVTRLKEAEAALREEARRKDEFLATLAHELRNPLAPIRNSVEMLRLADSNGELLAKARTLMERQVGQMVRLVDDLLDLSRISRGKVELRRQRVALADIVQNAVETSRPLIQEKAHELTINVPPEPIYLDADPTRLSQIISNLLHNAAKYTEKAGHIWLSAEQQGTEAVLSVRDTGIGIAAEHLPHLFKMFTQLTPALERSLGGLGVGLALVRGLVELHGGTVEAHSGGVGRGSEFIVRLPIAEAPTPGPQEAGQAPVQAGAESASGRTCRVLIVDDNRDAADSLAVMLRLTGHETQTAYDGVEGVQAAATFLPDVVLLDIGMPRMNGYQAAQHIRQQPWGQKMVLIALTGWGQAEDKQRAAEAGFHHHLTKPVEPTELEQLLDELTQAPKIEPSPN